MKTVILKVKELHDIFPNKKIVRKKCINPTKTLTEGKYYDTILRENQWRPTWYGDYRNEAYKDMIGVLNDNNQYVEVSIDRFK